MPRPAIAIDLGGTNLRGAVVSAAGDILVETSRPTLAQEGSDAVIERIAETVAEVAAQAGVEADVPIGIGCPGPLDTRQGVVLFTPNLVGWENVPLRDRLAAATGRHVELANDANAAALGEMYFGAGRGHQNMVWVGLGTGVGGGVISEGRLIDGARGMGGELGHVSVSIDGPRCHCGSLGCIEAYCSAWALTDEATRLVTSGRGDAILAHATDGIIGPRAIGAAAAAGDRAALQLLARAGTALGVGLANFVQIFNPEIVVIGGGVAEIGEPLLAPARRAIETYSFPSMHEGLVITHSLLGVKTGTYGAAALVFYAGHP
jgi:glucokinase